MEMESQNLSEEFVNMKITKEKFDRIYDENISKKEYDQIIEEIDERFFEITRAISKKNPEMWIDYSNCNYGHDDCSDGRFDPEDYKEFIYIGGEFVNIPKPYGYDNSFPTRWLWEDFEQEFRE